MACAANPSISLQLFHVTHESARADDKAVPSQSVDSLF
jgi:hypothetical protein